MKLFGKYEEQVKEMITENKEVLTKVGKTVAVGVVCYVLGDVHGKLSVLTSVASRANVIINR